MKTPEEVENVSCDVDDSSDDDDDSFDGGELENFNFFPICYRDTNNLSLSFPTLSEAINHDRQHNQFDFLEFLPSSDDEDFFEKVIMCVNKCRTFILGLDTDLNIGSELSAHLKASMSSGEDDEQFFKPVLQDDAVLMCLDELQHLNNKNETCLENSFTEKETISSLNMQLLALKEQLRIAKSCITSLTDGKNEDQKEKGKTNKTIEDEIYHSNR